MQSREMEIPFLAFRFGRSRHELRSFLVLLNPLLHVVTVRVGPLLGQKYF
jgi:hypothetical protein